MQDINVRLFIAVVAFIIIVVMYLIGAHYIKNKQSDVLQKYLSGYWIADKGFCNSSDVDNILLFIGEKHDKSKKKSPYTHTAYFIISDTPDNIIMQELVDAKLSPLCVDISNINKCTASLDFNFESPTCIPKKVSIQLDMYRGQLKIYKGKDMYGVFNKHHEVSNVTENVNLSKK